MAYNPKIVLEPSFGVTRKEIREKVKGKNVISENSTLVLDGDISLENVNLDGSVWAQSNLKDFEFKDKNYLEFKAVDINDNNKSAVLRMRGFELNTEGIKKV